MYITVDKYEKELGDIKIGTPILSESDNGLSVLGFYRGIINNKKLCSTQNGDFELKSNMFIKTDNTVLVGQIQVKQLMESLYEQVANEYDPNIRYDLREKAKVYVEEFLNLHK